MSPARERRDVLSLAIYQFYNEYGEEGGYQLQSYRWYSLWEFDSWTNTITRAKHTEARLMYNIGAIQKGEQDPVLMACSPAWPERLAGVAWLQMH